jgi:hypothetical protein
MNKQLQQTFELVQNLPLSDQIALFKLIFKNLVTQPLERLQLIDTVFQLLRETVYTMNQPALPKPTMTSRNGIPLFPTQPNSKTVTLEFINELRDEMP